MTYPNDKFYYLNNKFRDKVTSAPFRILHETDNFVLAFNPDSDPLDLELLMENYYIINKNTQKVETSVNSYPGALNYLHAAQEALDALTSKVNIINKPEKAKSDTNIN